jgi:signal transduction histidine kinase
MTTRQQPDITFSGFNSCVDVTERKVSGESLHTLTGRLIRAQEEERARIALELHDDFSQRLALLAVSLGQLWKDISASEVGQRMMVLDILKAIREISSDLHLLSHQLHSSKLEHVGLVAALRGLCKEFSEKYPVQVRFSESGFPLSLPKDVELSLFRVTQESLRNVAKHSHAERAHVELRANGDSVSLRVSDEGRGFDINSRERGTGIGLTGMTERVRLVGGRLFVKSKRMNGTEILAEVPLIPVATNEEQVTIQAAGGVRHDTHAVAACRS